MGYPWPSFGSFQFRKTETAHFDTDAGWILAPTYSQTRPIGSTVDHVVAISIGSATRTFEVNLEPQRLNQLQALLNTVADFTDWARPAPDSRSAFLLEVTPIEQVIHYANDNTNGTFQRELRVKISLVSQNASLVTP